MNWDYIAGLFDGEGGLSIYLTRTKRQKGNIAIFVKIGATITGSIEHMKQVREFLINEGIKVSACISSAKPTCLTLSIYGTDSIKIFSTKIEPHLFLKIPQLQIIKEALLLKKTYGEHFEIIKHISEFDSLRHRLHGYARKGHDLRPWNISQSPM